MFLTLVRDHVLARSKGGPDAIANRVASCAACDRIKGGARVETVEAARQMIHARRVNRLAKFHTVRATVRGIVGGAI